MGNHFAGCGLLGIVIHFGIKSGNQQVVTYILVPNLIQLTIPKSTSSCKTSERRRVPLPRHTKHHGLTRKQND